MILLIFILLIFTEAAYEALKLKGKDTLSGVIEFFNRAVTIILLSMFLAGWRWNLKNDGLFYVLGGYILLRFAIFDFVFNITARLPLFYIGTTKIYDLLWQKFFEWTKFPKEHFLWMFKFIALLIGIVWLI